MTARDPWDDELATKRKQLIRKLALFLDLMETVGQNDMGLLPHAFAARFHRITDEYRNMILDLQRTMGSPD
jgi:hypothetical protein